jgi:hypothetical protein
VPELGGEMPNGVKLPLELKKLKNTMCTAEKLED